MGPPAEETHYNKNRLYDINHCAFAWLINAHDIQYNVQNNKQNVYTIFTLKNENTPCSA